MRLFYALLLLSFLGAPAFAEEASPVLCKVLHEYRAVDGVEHVGDAAVPADVNPLSAAVHVVNIPVSVDLAQRFGLALPVGFELKPDVAMMEIYPDGRVFYNGQDLSGQMADICRDGAAEDRQAGKDALSSPSEKETIGAETGANE